MSILTYVLHYEGEFNKNSLGAVSEGSLRCERQAEYGYDTVDVELPAVISVGDAINEPRYPSLKGIMGAESQPQETVSLSDLGVDGLE